MKKFKLSREIRVGIMTIVAIFVLYFGLNFLKGIDIFSPINYYYAEYEDVGGLVPSSPVFIKGYKVGQVEEVIYDFTKKSSFVVRISVSKDIKLPKQTIVELFDDGLMGGKAIQLVNVQQSTYNDIYQSGDTIQSQIGSGLMQQLAGDLMPKLNLIFDQTDSLVRSVRLLVDGGSIQKSLVAIEKTTSDLSESSAAIKKMMKSDMPKLINNVNDITSDFKIVSGNIKNIDFANTFQNLDITIKDLKQVSGKLNSNDGTIGLLLNDKTLYFNLSDMSKSADNLLVDIKKSPKRYVNFSLFGSKN
ncbi:MlaD family protein [Paludibacter sp.]